MASGITPIKLRELLISKKPVFTGEQSLLMSSKAVHAALISLRSLNLKTTREQDHISSTVYILLIVDMPHTKILALRQSENVHTAQRICFLHAGIWFLKMNHVLLLKTC